MSDSATFTAARARSAAAGWAPTATMATMRSEERPLGAGAAFGTSFTLAVSREARDALVFAVRTFAAIPEEALAHRLRMPAGSDPSRWRGSFGMLATKADRVLTTAPRRGGTWHVPVSAVQGERLAHALAAAIGAWRLPEGTAALLAAGEGEALAALALLGAGGYGCARAWEVVLAALAVGGESAADVVVPLGHSGEAGTVDAGGVGAAREPAGARLAEGDLFG